MTTGPSTVKHVYDIVALFALLHVIAIFALGSFLIGTGALDSQKVRRVAAVLRGDDAAQEESKTPEEPPPTGTTTPTGEKDIVAESQMDIEIMRREGERIKAELDQRLALNNSILLRVMTERERFQRERDEGARRQETAGKQRREEGFKKQLAIYESLAPKVAVEHLLAMSDPDEAARILLEMATRKAKKIVEVAKRGDQMGKMKVILRRVREVAPDRSQELETGGP